MANVWTFLQQLFGRHAKQPNASSGTNAKPTANGGFGASNNISLDELIALRNSLPQQRLYARVILGLGVIACIIAYYFFRPTFLLALFATMSGWASIFVFLGLVGIYPISYLAYRSFSDDAKRTRLKDEFELFGLVSPEKLDETVDTLYRNVYNWKQFTGYILLIILVSGIIFFGQWSSTLFTSPIAAVVVYGYAGAYVFSVQELVRRYNTFDLQPQVYSSILVRFLIAIAITFIMGSLLLSDSSANVGAMAASVGETTGALSPSTAPLTTTVNLSNTQMMTTTADPLATLFPMPLAAGARLPTWIIIAAFTIGIFPSIGIRWFVLQANRLLNPPISQESELPLRNLLGVSTWHEARLSMMGIDDAQNLATVDIPRLLLTTQFDTQQVANWIDQAILYVKVGSRINRFREAKVTTFHEFLQTLYKLDAKPRLLVSFGDDANVSNVSLSAPPAPAPEQQLANLSIVLGLTSPDELYRLSDFSGFPNYTHITAYYEGIARVGTQRAERSVQRQTSGGVIERLRVGASLDPEEQAMLNQRLERLLRQPVTRFKDYRYCVRLGDTYYKLGMHTEARACLLEAIQLNPKASEAHYSLCLAYLSQKKYEQAIWHITQAIALNSADALLYNLRGSIYIERKQYEEALPDLDQAIQFDRTLAVAYLNRSIANNALQRYTETIRDAERARLLGNDEFGLWFVWGVALLGVDDNKGAIEKLSQAIIRSADSVEELIKGAATKSKDDLADAFANRGAAYMNLGASALDHAESDLKTATALNDGYYQCYNRLGIIADYRRKYLEATDYFAVALAHTPQTGPEYFDIRYNLGDAYLKVRKFIEALEQYQQLRSWAKENPLAPDQQAKLERLADQLNLSPARLQSLEEALQLTETIDDKAGMAFAKKQLAQYYRHSGETQMALHHYRDALKLYAETKDEPQQSLIQQEMNDLLNQPAR